MSDYSVACLEAGMVVLTVSSEEGAFYVLAEPETCLERARDLWLLGTPRKALYVSIGSLDTGVGANAWAFERRHVPSSPALNKGQEKKR